MNKHEKTNKKINITEEKLEIYTISRNGEKEEREKEGEISFGSHGYEEWSFNSILHKCSKMS